MPAKKTILIIEDEPHIVLGLKDALEFEGFRVASAGKGRDGVALAKHEKPDAVLLDLMLPDINGYKVCEELRRWDPFVPIIMLTARSQEVDKIRGLDAGRRRLRHQAVQRRRAHRAHPRHLPPHRAQRRGRPRGHRDRRRATVNLTGHTPEARRQRRAALVLRGRALASLARARSASRSRAKRS